MLAETRYAWPMHDPLTELATVPAVPLHPALLDARASLAATIADLGAIPDGSLERPWRWRSTDPADLDVRYGIYRIHERLQTAIAAIEAGRSVAPAMPVGPAVPALAALAEARWELHGALASVAEADWDADPGGDQWTIRQTLGHIVGGQRGYSWYNAWYLKQGVVDGEAVYPPDGLMPQEPSEEEEAEGAPEVVAARFDEIVDASIAANAGLDGTALRVSARWSGLPVTIDFRFGRYGSHIREHTVQVDKTLVMLGRQPTEVERLVRLVMATYGRLESRLVGRASADLERPFADGTSAVAILAAAVDDVAGTAASVRAASA